MNNSLLSNYVNRLHEGIASIILKRLFATKIKPALDQAADILDTDPDFKKDMQDVQDKISQVERRVDRLCRQNPDHYLCKDRGPRFKWRS